MLTSDEIKTLDRAQYLINSSKSNEFDALKKFLIEQIKLLLLDSNGKPKNIVEIIFSIRKMVNFFKAIIAMFKAELS